MSQLLPDGLSLFDAPFTIVGAIRQAMVVLSWFENLPKDEIPPRRLWLDGKGLEAWFEQVEQKRKDKMKTDSGTQQDGWTGEMKQNQAVAQMIITD